MENPYSDKMMPETGETLDAMQLRVYANAVWDEGHTAATVEQTEIVSDRKATIVAYEIAISREEKLVSELVTALSFYLVDWSVDETIHQATIDFAIAAQEKARKATQ